MVIHKIVEVVSNYSNNGVLNTHIPHLEGEEIFGSSKQKMDLPLGFDSDSHRPDKVDFSIPRVVQTRSTRAHLSERILTSPFHSENNECMDKRPIQIRHANNVFETNCDVAKWHIAHCPTKFAKQCCAFVSNYQEKMHSSNC